MNLYCNRFVPGGFRILDSFRFAPTDDERLAQGPSLQLFASYGAGRRSQYEFGMYKQEVPGKVMITNFQKVLQHELYPHLL
jgi:hypothetical protein